MAKTYLMEKYSMRIICADGTVKISQFREAVPYEDFNEKLVDFISSYIGHSLIFEDFSRTILEWRFDDVQYTRCFETLEAMHKWCLTII